MNPYLLPVGLEDDRPWRLRAACRDADPDLFFHPDGEREPSRSRRERDAIAYCGRCPVRVECLDLALESGARHGVWGGVPEELVRVMRPRSGRVPVESSTWTT